MINTKLFLEDLGYLPAKKKNKYFEEIKKNEGLPLGNVTADGWPYYAPNGSSDVPIEVEDPRFSGVGTTFKNRAFKPSSKNYKIKPNNSIKKEYIPTINKITGFSKGVKMLATVMAMKEGFYPKSRSYRTNNPGNIGNTDAGGNNNFATLEDGIRGQLKYLTKVAEGKHRAYPLNSPKDIKPYRSPEIERNVKTYGLTPFLPGYKFTYTGKLSQFVKIYATGARVGNFYLTYIINFFKINGVSIDENTTLLTLTTINDNKKIKYS
tara:strand:- start:187 stop:981 length:795 start_codon:yes stop_codon:yes gene_type:complete